MTPFSLSWLQVDSHPVSRFQRGWKQAAGARGASQRVCASEAMFPMLAALAGLAKGHRDFPMFPRETRGLWYALIPLHRVALCNHSVNWRDLIQTS